MVVYGHTPVPEAEWVNSTICLDTGCVFGGKLTALRYPERELVSVPAGAGLLRARPAARRRRAAPGPAAAAAQREPAELDIDDVIGKRIIETRLTGSTVTIREENARRRARGDEPVRRRPALAHLPAADHVAARHVRRRPGSWSTPREAFAAYRAAGVTEVVCEEKHMGSRAVVIVCADESVAAAAVRRRRRRPRA